MDGLLKALSFLQLFARVEDPRWTGTLFVPREASSVAGELDALFWTLTGITIFFSTLIAALIVFFSIKYRRGATVNRQRDESARGHRMRLYLEIFWTVTPLLICLVIYVWAASLFFRLKVPPRDAMEIHVVAKQWMWKFQHPEGQREIDILHVPVGQAVKLIMTSQDVIHSLFIPAFRIKQDVLPGYYTNTWFRATRTGEYPLLCTQYCGTNHSRMRGMVVVMDPSDFQRWLSSTTANVSMAASGSDLFQRMGCAGCHETGGVRAPVLKGLFGSRVKLTDGRVIVADRSYIHDSIVQPAKDIVAGYAPIMPTFKGVLSEDQITLLVEYIRSLSSPQSEEVKK